MNPCIDTNWFGTLGVLALEVGEGHVPATRGRGECELCSLKQAGVRRCGIWAQITVRFRDNSSRIRTTQPSPRLSANHSLNPAEGVKTRKLGISRKNRCIYYRSRAVPQCKLFGKICC